MEARPIGTLRAHSITYRIAVGPNAGRKALTLRTLPGREPNESPAGLLAKTDGFSLHAGVTVGARDTAKRERLCRYLARPPVAHDRLSLTRDGLRADKSAGLPTCAAAGRPKGRAQGCAR